MIDPAMPPLASDILDAVLAELGEGGPSPVLDPALWIVRFPGREAEVAAVLDAVAGYQEELGSVRDRSEGESDVPLLAPGSVLGDFVLGEVLGKGAMGVVHRARQSSLGAREVAVKLLDGHLLARDSRFFERFRREATLSATMHHPHLAEVYGFHVVGGRALIAMRLVEGCTLQDALARAHADSGYDRGAPHVRRCVELVRDLAAALQAIHAKGFVHRDVKPTNVMLERGAAAGAPFDGRPVLVDFGLLRPSGDTDLTRSRTILGTPAYSSPEGQLGRELDARTDVFSLGVLLHDLLALTQPAGRPPATAGLPDLHELNSAVDVRLAAIVRMATQERRELRYENGGAFQLDLEHWLRGEPVRARPASPLSRVRLWMRRKPADAARVVAALMVVAVVATALLTVGLRWLELRKSVDSALAAERDGRLVTAFALQRPLLQVPGWGRDLVIDDAERRVLGRWWADEDSRIGSLRRHLLRAAQIVERTRDTDGWAGSDTSWAKLSPGERKDAILELERAHQELLGVLLDGWRPDASEAGDRPAQRDFPGLRRPIAGPLFAFLRRELAADRPYWAQARAAATWAHLLMLMQTPAAMQPCLDQLGEARARLEAGLRVGTGSVAGFAWLGPAEQQVVARAVRRFNVGSMSACATFTDRRGLEFLVQAIGDMALDHELGAGLLCGYQHVSNWLHVNGILRPEDRPAASHIAVVEATYRWFDALPATWEFGRGFYQTVLAHSVLAFGDFESRLPTEPPEGWEPTLWQRFRTEAERWSLASRHFADGGDDDPAFHLRGLPHLHLLRSARGDRLTEDHTPEIWLAREGAGGLAGELLGPADPGANRAAAVFCQNRDNGRAPPGLGQPLLEPFLEGGARRAVWRAARFVVPTESSYEVNRLEMVGVGHARLEFTAHRVPDAELRITLWHHRAARRLLPEQGEVYARLSVPEFDIAVEMRAGDGGGARHSLVLDADVQTQLSDADEVTVVVDYLRGNTTYRIDELRLDWTPTQR